MRKAEEVPAWAQELLSRFAALEARFGDRESIGAPRRALKLKDAAAALGISLSTLKERIASGLVQTIQIGGKGHPKVAEAEIRRLLTVEKSGKRASIAHVAYEVKVAEPPNLQDALDTLRAWKP